MKKLSVKNLIFDHLTYAEMKNSVGGYNGCMRYFSCSRCGWSAWVNVCEEVARCGCGYETPLQ